MYWHQSVTFRGEFCLMDHTGEHCVFKLTAKLLIYLSIVYLCVLKLLHFCILCPSYELLYWSGKEEFSLIFFIRPINVIYIYSDFVFEYCQVDTFPHLTLLCSWCVSIYCPVLFSNVTDSCICHVLSVFIIRWMTLVLILLVNYQHKHILVLMLCHVNYHLVCFLIRSSSLLIH